MKKVEFVFFDAGGGHRSAANALKAVIEQQVRDWSVHLMNMQEDLDSLDIFRKITRVRFQDLYNKMLAKGWTLGSEYLLPPMHGIIRIFHGAQVRMLTDIWRAKQPDMVVSVVPNFNRALFQSLQRANPEIPFVTILTDMADYPPNFWLERQDHYVICGTERAYQQALASGKRPERTFLTSGMILRPAFYEKFQHDRAAERRKIGLDSDEAGSADALRRSGVECDVEDHKRFAGNRPGPSADCDLRTQREARGQAAANALTTADARGGVYD